MSKIPEEYYQEIKNIYPSVQIDDIQIFDDGWDYLVCAVKEQEVFRFPRREDYATKLPNEVAFLDLFASQSPIPVPQMQQYTLPNGFPYVRYPFIKGQPFTIELAKTFSQEQLATIAQQLGKFLTTLHAFSLEQAKALGFGEITDLLKEWHELFTKTQRMIFPLLDAYETVWITQQFTDFFTLVEKSTIIKRLTHGDIMARHIIVNANNNTLSGIIDFGDVAIGDPAFDFAFLGKYGQAFLKQVYTSYELPKDDMFEKRRQFYANRSLIANLEHAIALDNKKEIIQYKRELQEFISQN